VSRWEVHEVHKATLASVARAYGIALPRLRLRASQQRAKGKKVRKSAAKPLETLGGVQLCAGANMGSSLEASGGQVEKAGRAGIETEQEL
jgi:hypothetical protein